MDSKRQKDTERSLMGSLSFQSVQETLYQGKDHLSTAMEACFIEIAGDIKGTLQTWILSHLVHAGERKIVANLCLPQCEF